MATNWLNLKGTIKWAKVYEPDEAFGQKNWKINFYPANEAEWEKFNKTGLMLKVNEDTDGKYVTFRRPTTKVIKDELVVFLPPELTGEVKVTYKNGINGERLRQYNKGDKVEVEREGDQTTLGNGTEAIVNICYYSTLKGPGHRLESLKIISLVEYGGNSGPTVSEDTTEEDQPSTFTKDLDDDIPF